MASLLVFFAGCGDDTVEPVFDTVGRIQGQVVYFDADPPARISITRRDPLDLYLTTRDEWEAELDADGRFDVPLPVGTYGVRLLATGSSHSNTPYLTPWGFRDWFDPDTCGVLVDAALPPAHLQAELGRATIRLDLPFDEFLEWELRMKPPHGLSWSRQSTQTPESDELVFEMTRLPLIEFDVMVETPFDEMVSPALFLAGADVGYVLPDAQGLEEYRAVLPEPTWIEVRTTPVPEVPGLFSRGLTASIRKLSGYSGFSKIMTLSEDRTMGSARIPMFTRSPFQVFVVGSYSEVPAGGAIWEDARVYLPDPGQTVEVEVEVGVVVCLLSPATGLAGPSGHTVRLLDTGTGQEVGEGRTSFDSETGVARAAILASPGTFDAYFYPSDIDSAAPQAFGRPIEVRTGELETIEWTLGEGASLHGRLGKPWKPGDRFEVRTINGSTWRPTLELGDDNRTFTVRHVADGFHTLVHDQGEERVYYPGTIDESTSEVIHVSGSQDIHGLTFRR